YEPTNEAPLVCGESLGRREERGSDLVAEVRHHGADGERQHAPHRTACEAPIHRGDPSHYAVMLPLWAGDSKARRVSAAQLAQEVGAINDTPCGDSRNPLREERRYPHRLPGRRRWADRHGPRPRIVLASGASLGGTGLRPLHASARVVL